MQRHLTGGEEGWKGTGHLCEAREAVNGVNSSVPTLSAALYLMLFCIRKALVALHGWNKILLEDGSGI